MADDHDVLDLEHPHAELQRGAGAVIARVGAYGGTRLATLRTTNSSPGPVSKIICGSTRESEQAITRALGFWPSAASASKRSRSRGQRSVRKR
jgi:hypothetical protein